MSELAVGWDRALAELKYHGRDFFLSINPERTDAERNIERAALKLPQLPPSAVSQQASMATTMRSVFTLVALCNQIGRNPQAKALPKNVASLLTGLRDTLGGKTFRLIAREIGPNYHSSALRVIRQKGSKEDLVRTLSYVGHWERYLDGLKHYFQPKGLSIKVEYLRLRHFELGEEFIFSRGAAGQLETMRVPLTHYWALRALVERGTLPSAANYLGITKSKVAIRAHTADHFLRWAEKDYAFLQNTMVQNEADLLFTRASNLSEYLSKLSPETQERIFKLLGNLGPVASRIMKDPDLARKTAGNLSNERVSELQQAFYRNSRLAIAKLEELMNAILQTHDLPVF